MQHHLTFLHNLCSIIANSPSNTPDRCPSWSPLFSVPLGLARPLESTVVHRLALLRRLPSSDSHHGRKPGPVVSPCRPRQTVVTRAPTRRVSKPCPQLARRPDFPLARVAGLRHPSPRSPAFPEPGRVRHPTHTSPPSHLQPIALGRKEPLRSNQSHSITRPALLTTNLLATLQIAPGPDLSPALPVLGPLRAIRSACIQCRTSFQHSLIPQQPFARLRLCRRAIPLLHVRLAHQQEQGRPLYR